MSDDDNDFLEAILADPDDDISRLIYADWLDEQGDPRGEFIRVQCESAGHVANYDAESMQCKQMDARADELLKKHRADWETGLQAAFKGARNYHVKGIFRRGMLEGIEVLNGAQDIDKKVETGEQEPSENTDFPMDDFLERLSGFLNTPNGSTVSALSFGKSDAFFDHVPPELDDAMMEKMAGCEALRSIKELTLNRQSKVSTRGIAALSAEGSSLHGLESLQMYLSDWAFLASREARLPPEQQSQLAGQMLARFKHLKSLTLPNEIHYGLLRGLLETSPPPLEALHIDAFSLYEQGTQLLADSPIKKTLRKLYVENAQYVNTENPIRHDLCAILPQFTQLESLTFDKIYTLNRDSMKSLSQCANLRALTLKEPEFFNIRRSQKPPHRCGVLFAPDSRLTKLKSLNIDIGSFLSNNAQLPFLEGDVAALASPDCPLKNLSYLTLKQCELYGREDELSDFMRSPLAGQLKLLNLHRNTLSSVPLEAFASRPGFTRMERLDYGYNHIINSRVTSVICTSSSLENLQELAFAAYTNQREGCRDSFLKDLSKKRQDILAGKLTQGGLPEISNVALTRSSNSIQRHYISTPLAFDPNETNELDITMPSGEKVSKKLEAHHEAEEKKAKEAEAAAKGEQAPAEEKSPTSEISSSKVYYDNLRRRRGEQ